MFKIRKNYITCTFFYLKELKLKTLKRYTANYYDKKEYVIHITNLKTSIKSQISIEKV